MEDKNSPNQISHKSKQNNRKIYYCACCGIDLFSSNYQINPTQKEESLNFSHSLRDLSLLKAVWNNEKYFQASCPKCDEVIGILISDYSQVGGKRYYVHQKSLIESISNANLKNSKQKNNASKTNTLINQISF